MANIIAGIFGNITQANEAVDELRGAQFGQQDISVFHLNAAGQHDQFPIGGDENADPGAEDAHKNAGIGAAVGAVAIGVAAIAAGPAAIAAAAAVGAYTGSLGGALSGMGQEERARRAGVMVAINASGDNEGKAVDLLRRHGAMDIEKADGEWRAGQWVDFDPVGAPCLIDNPTRQSARA